MGVGMCPRISQGPKLISCPHSHRGFQMQKTMYHSHAPPLYRLLKLLVDVFVEQSSSTSVYTVSAGRMLSMVW